MSVTLPGDLVSPVAGPLLRRGAPVIDIYMGDPGVVVWTGPVNEKGAYPALVYSLDLDTKCECGTRCAASLFALDLFDPAGMDIAARWLAAHHGLTVGATAPLWHRMTEIAPVWWLVGHSGLDREETDAEYRAVCAAFHDSDLVLPGRGGYGSEPRRIPGIAAITDPAEALRAACLAAVGRTG